jgi:hypothetical protein
LHVLTVNDDVSEGPANRRCKLFSDLFGGRFLRFEICVRRLARLLGFQFDDLNRVGVSLGEFVLGKDSFAVVFIELMDTLVLLVLN